MTKVGGPAPATIVGVQSTANEEHEAKIRGGTWTWTKGREGGGVRAGGGGGGGAGKLGRPCYLLCSHAPCPTEKLSATVHSSAPVVALSEVRLPSSEPKTSVFVAASSAGDMKIWPLVS